MPGFFESAHLWWTQMLAGIVAGALCGFLGVYVVLRRVVFVSAALGEVAGVGVVMAFFLASQLAGHEAVEPSHAHHAHEPGATHGPAAGSADDDNSAQVRPAAPGEPGGPLSDEALDGLLAEVGVEPAAAKPTPGGAAAGSLDKMLAYQPSARAAAIARAETGGHGFGAAPWWLQPLLVALVFVVVASIALSITPRYRRITQEAVIGLAYLLATALVILVGSRIPQGTHEIRHVLYGDSVSLAPGQLYGLLGAAVAVVLLHAVLFKDFLFVSFDSQTARVAGLPTRTLNVLILVSVGVVIAAAARAIGALPVFAFLVLPPLAALLATSSFKATFVLSAVLGAVAASLGYYLAWVWRFPAGAMRVATAAALVLPAVLIRWRRGGR